MMLLKLAWRNILRRKRRTLITAASIAFGCVLCLFFTGLSDGMYGKVTRMAVRMGSGHLVIEHPEYRDDPVLEHTVTAAPELLEALRQVPEVEGYSLRISGPGMVSSSRGSVGGGFDAVDPRLDRDISLLVKGIIEGRYLSSAGDMIVGTDMARKLQTRLGGKVVVTTRDRHGETVQELFRVVGIFETKSALLDGFYFQVTLDKAQQMLDLDPSQVTQLGVYLSDAKHQDEVAAALRRLPQLASVGGVVTRWQEVLKDLADYIKVDNAFNYIFQVLLFLVILAGVLNTVLMSVMERMYEFGVLLSLGMSRARLTLMVVMECLMLAVIGTAAGGLLGALLNTLLYHHPISFAGSVSEMSVGGFFIEPSLHMNLTLHHFLVTMIAIFIMILVAGLYPAWKAGRVEPVEVLQTF